MEHRPEHNGDAPRERTPFVFRSQGFVGTQEHNGKFHRVPVFRVSFTGVTGGFWVQKRLLFDLKMVGVREFFRRDKKLVLSYCRFDNNLIFLFCQISKISVYNC